MRTSPSAAITEHWRNILLAILARISDDMDRLCLRQVSTEDAQAYADENGLVYWETSAKTNANVSELFEDIAKRCVFNLRLNTSH